LDVGCGTGTLTLAAKRRAGPTGEVHGIDAAPETIDVARRKAAHAGLDVDFQVGLIEDIPFPDNHFDVVLSSLMLHHLPDDVKRQGFVEIYRILKPGGRLRAVDFAPPDSHLLRALTTLFFGHRMAHNDVQNLATLAQKAGFADVQTGRTQVKLLSFVSGEKPVRAE